MRIIRSLLYTILVLLAVNFSQNAHAIDITKIQTDTTLIDDLSLLFEDETTDYSANEIYLNSKVKKVKKSIKYTIPEIIPDSVTKSIDDLAYYIMVNYQTDKDRLWAAYSWICLNIKYSPAGSNLQDRYHGLELANYSLKRKVGVCANYAELFYQLAKKMGIESYVVNGYNIEQNVSENPRHAWVICMLDSIPYAFEPTWGAGYYKNKKKKFTFKFKPRWFAVPTHNSIYTSTHFPFISYFQCSNSPHTFEERYYNVEEHTQEADYNWQDTLKYYTQIADSLKRAEFGLRDMKKYLTISVERKYEKYGPRKYYIKYVRPGARNYKKQFKKDIDYQKWLISNLQDIRIANILDKQVEHLVQISSKWEDAWNKSKTSAHWPELVNGANTIIDRLNKIKTDKSYYKWIIKELKYCANSYVKYPDTKGVSIRNHRAKARKTARKQITTSRYTIEKDLYKKEQRIDHESLSLTKMVRKKEMEFLFDVYKKGQRTHSTLKFHIAEEIF